MSETMTCWSVISAERSGPDGGRIRYCGKTPALSFAEVLDGVPICPEHFARAVLRSLADGSRDGSDVPFLSAVLAEARRLRATRPCPHVHREFVIPDAGPLLGYHLADLRCTVCTASRGNLAVQLTAPSTVPLTPAAPLATYWDRYPRPSLERVAGLLNELAGSIDAAYAAITRELARRAGTEQPFRCHDDEHRWVVVRETATVRNSRCGCGAEWAQWLGALPGKAT